MHYSKLIQFETTISEIMTTMIETISYPLISLEGEYLDEIKVTWDFANQTSKHVIHRALIKERSNSRYGNSSTKTRSEVRGGGKKPWRQKGTGKARAGSNRSPLWRGGGVIFGPKPKHYSLKLNRKEHKVALSTAMFNAAPKTAIIKDFSNNLDSPNTKHVKRILENLGIENKNKVLILVSEKSNNLILSCRNIPSVSLVSDSQLNIKEILNVDFILATQKALEDLQELYNDH
uniref:Large ribosomal subunit protein uL4c n=1 Tax=Gronococcus sybilensis TaxID=3028029 RepID=A0A9Y1MXL8_9RHOD|nr:ribosomal protein L4 [Gronococcus sybilensis]